MKSFYNSNNDFKLNSHDNGMLKYNYLFNNLNIYNIKNIENNDSNIITKYNYLLLFILFIFIVCKYIK